MKKFEVLGSGVSLPALQVSSRQLDQQKGFAQGTVEQRTGVASRHYAVDESASDLASIILQNQGRLQPIRHVSDARKRALSRNQKSD